MSGKQDHTLVLSGDAGIKAAAEVAESLKQALERHRQVSVDTQTLSIADITTIQTLLAARKAAQAEGKSLSMAAPLAAPLHALLKATGFLSHGQSDRDFWLLSSDQPQDATA